MKRTPLRRRSKSAYKTLRAKALKIFHRYIVLRDDEVCFTCGKPANQCGHFIHRNALDFDETNNHAQCSHCNLYLSGNLRIYTLNMIDKYGRLIVDDLHTNSQYPVRFPQEFLENIIKTYEPEVKRLEENKKIEDLK